MVQGAAEGNNVYWQYIVFSYNENDIEEAEKMAIDNGITFMMTESSRWLSKDDPLRPSKHFVNRIIGREFEMMGKLNDS
jgi:hypothetical protein